MSGYCLPIRLNTFHAGFWSTGSMRQDLDPFILWDHFLRRILINSPANYYLFKAQFNFIISSRKKTRFILLRKWRHNLRKQEYRLIPPDICSLCNDLRMVFNFTHYILSCNMTVMHHYQGGQIIPICNQIITEQLYNWNHNSKHK